MAKIETSTFFEHFSGKIDDFIVYMHRNKRCIRRKPTGIKPPSTPGQVAQQERMAAIAIFYQALKEVGIYAYWQKAAEGLLPTGYNLLVKNNLPAFSGEGRICDFSKIQMTMGNVPLPDDLNLSAGEGSEWVLQWNNTPHTSRSKENDRLWVVAMKDYETFDVAPLDTGECCRKDCRAKFQIPETLKDYTHLFVIFCSRTGGMCSESRYFNINFKLKNYGNL